MNKKAILTCAVTGAGDTVRKSPYVPVTPEEIAKSAIDAAKQAQPLPISTYVIRKREESAMILPFSEK